MSGQVKITDKDLIKLVQKSNSTGYLQGTRHGMLVASAFWLAIICFLNFVTYAHAEELPEIQDTPKLRFIVEHNCQPEIKWPEQPEYGLTIKATPDKVWWQCDNGRFYF